MQEYGGNTIEVILNDQVKYYDKGMAGGRARQEISFSSFAVDEWIAVRGWTNDDPLKPAQTVRAVAVYESTPPGEATESGE